VGGKWSMLGGWWVMAPEISGVDGKQVSK